MFMYTHEGTLKLFRMKFGFFLAFVRQYAYNEIVGCLIRKIGGTSDVHKKELRVLTRGLGASHLAKEGLLCNEGFGYHSNRAQYSL